MCPSGFFLSHRLLVSQCMHGSHCMHAMHTCMNDWLKGKRYVAMLLCISAGVRNNVFTHGWCTPLPRNRHRFAPCVCDPALPRSAHACMHVRSLSPQHNVMHQKQTKPLIFKTLKIVTKSPSMTGLGRTCICHISAYTPPRASSSSCDPSSTRVPSESTKILSQSLIVLRRCATNTLVLPFASSCKHPTSFLHTFMHLYFRTLMLRAFVSYTKCTANTLPLSGNAILIQVVS